MAAAAHAIGGDEAYRALGEVFACAVGYERWLVVRYAPASLPQIVVNHAIPEAAIETYQGGLHRFDPLARLVNTGQPPRLVAISRLRDTDPDNRYYDEIYRAALIRDELAILLGLPGGVYLALCLDRAEGDFTDRDLERAERVRPTIEGLHKAHLRLVLSGSGEAGERAYPGQQPFQIRDRRGAVLQQSVGWTETVCDQAAAIEEASASQDEMGSLPVGGAHVIKWEPYRPEGQGARIFVVEPLGSVPPLPSLDSLLSLFSKRHGLTPRERDIIGLALRGVPNPLIARELGISAGTVRNHRRRLYFKLDITTERELSALFLDTVLAQK